MVTLFHQLFEKLKKMFRLNQMLLTLLWTNFLISFCRFMAMPFMIIYFSNHLDISTTKIGFLIGLSPLASLIFGLFAGRFSDRIGEKFSLPLSLSIPALTLIGYTVTQNFYLLCLLSVISGIAWSVYNATNLTVLSKLTRENNREIVFGYNYWLFNLGAIAGPICGAYFGAGSSSLVIYLFSSVLILISILVYVMLKSKYSGQIATPAIEDSKDKEDFFKSLKIVITDKPLLWVTAGYFCIFFVQAQLETNMGVFLEHAFNDQGTKIFGQILSVSALIVLVLQPAAIHLFKKMNANLTFLIGAIVMAIGPLSFSFVHKPQHFLIAASILAVGEVIMTPKLQALIVKLPVEGLQATYFSFLNMGGNLAFFVGPWSGAYILKLFGANLLFYMMAALSILSGIYLVFSHNSHRKGQRRRSRPAQDFSVS